MAFISEFVSSLIIAIVQGITEWFPISSSGHIVIFERILDFEGGLAFNIALHFGTLLAVILYFYKDLWIIIKDFFSGRFDESKGHQGRLVPLLIIATIPAGIVGFLFKSYFESTFNNLSILALGFAINGIFLLISSIEFRKKEWKRISYGSALIIGVSQILAIFSSISRSGMTIGSGLLLKLKEKDAMRFSFLMSIPIILGADLLEIKTIFSTSTILPILVSFLVGFASIHLLYKKILSTKKNLRYFAIYTLILAAIISLVTLLK